MKTEKVDFLNIQLRISKFSSPELYEICEKAGPHARAKRIFSLAESGLFEERLRAMHRRDAENKK